MSKKYLKHPKEYYSSDVLWFIPNHRKPIAYSTKSCSDLIIMMSQNNKTIKDIFEQINYDMEAKNVLKQYIKYGFRDVVAKDIFS